MDITYVDCVFENNNSWSYQIFRINVNLNFYIQNSTFRNNKGLLIDVVPLEKSNPLIPTYVEVTGCTFENNFVGNNAIFTLSTNSVLKIETVTFINNFSLKRGSIVQCAFKEAKVNIISGVFK
jgi:hypothetical protein